MLPLRFDDSEVLMRAFDTPPTRQFAGNRLATGNRQHPFDAGSIGWVPVEGQPASNRTSSEHRLCGSELFGICGFEISRQIVEKPAFVT